MKERINLEIASDFNFKTAVYSHGWCELRPFHLDIENWRLRRAFDGPNGRPFDAEIYEGEGRVVVATFDPVDDPERLVRDVRHVLRLDEDLAGFYRMTDREKRLKWVAKLNAGRMLRSPTVWEDLVKTICTTNCSWGLTRIMVNNLVDKLGREGANGSRGFPTAEAMAGVPVGFYREEIRAGYRSAYFVELAEQVAGGALDPEKWLVSDLPTIELKKEMKKVKGVGDYAAENLLKLVGRYDGLALDSWLRAQFYAKHNGGEFCDDKQIEVFYEEFGRWRGLAIWCDMTEKWH